MGHLPAAALTQFEKGQPLKAADLNANFLIILALLEGVAREARTPDPVLVELEKRAGSVEERIDRLEHLTAMHARQRNEREWAPLSHVGALVTMVNEVQRKFTAATERIDEAHVGLGTVHDDLHRRLSRLEQQPEPALQEDFAPLVQDHNRLALKEHMLLAQIIALRHEMGLLREMQMGQDRLKNRTEYAPLSTIGHILQRLNAIEKRLP